MNPFKPNNGPIDRLKRNTYDLMYINNFTGNFGTLYPVFCKEVNPGDSLSIETVFGLRAQPMVFPVQTPIRADIHYFYVRNRTLWTNFMDFYGKTKEGLVHPYIDRPISDFKTKSIYDFLGVPTTVMSGSYISPTLAVNPYNYMDTWFSTGKDIVAGNAVSAIVNPLYGDPLIKAVNKKNSLTFFESQSLYFSTKCVGSSDGIGGTMIGGAQLFNGNFVSKNRINNPSKATWCVPGIIGPYLEYDSYINAFHDFSGPSTIWKFPKFSFINSNVDGNYNNDNNVSATGGIGACIQLYMTKSTWNLNSASEAPLVYTGCTFKLPSAYNSAAGKFGYKNGCLTFDSFSYNTGVDIAQIEQLRRNGYDLIVPLFLIYPANDMTDTETMWYKFYYGTFRFGGSVVLHDAKYVDKITDASELVSLPWCGGTKYMHLNALPYRAYEAIYNSFYRNQQVNPFKLTVNGQPEYNRYVTNLLGGADSTPYKLYQRNYEYDFLTGAFHSPQQGLAPLIGLTVNNSNQTATFKFSSPDINNGAEITATTKIDDGGQVIGITGYDPDLPQSNISRLMESINYGISINDIRQTNGLQRWLEKNIRRGYRYKDQLASHFGVNVSFNELLMPEFIGGASKPINVDTIYQTVTNENGVLGDYAGRAGVAGSSNHRVSKYCDEAGFIIGILSIVPTPVYSQVPAGYAFKHDLLDYYFPEFSKIGMQPIFKKHITPLQTAVTELNDVFGYQRPYWDLIRSVDEVHGEFRSTANGYVIQRMFAETPILNQNFLEINSEHLNDVFMITDTDVSDQFKGQIKFLCKRKTSIPLNAVPSIE